MFQICSDLLILKIPQITPNKFSPSLNIGRRILPLPHLSIKRPQPQALTQHTTPMLLPENY